MARRQHAEKAAEEEGGTGAIAAGKASPFAGAVSAALKYAPNALPKTNGASVTDPPGYARIVSGFT